MSSLRRAPLVLAMATVALGTGPAGAPARAHGLGVPDEEPATAEPGTSSPPSTGAGAAVAIDAEATPSEASEEIPPPPTNEADPYDRAGIEIIHAPDRPVSREQAEEEEQRRLDEELDTLPPPPDPEWRLRIGAGLGLPLAGASVPYLRLYQEIEWQPTGAAPFLFGLGGAEYVGGGVLGSAALRVGAATDFCRDSVVRCQAAIVIVLGAFFGQNLVAFDAGGEGDVRFLFGPLELSIRVGFGGGGGYNFLTGSGGVGVAF